MWTHTRILRATRFSRLVRTTRIRALSTGESHIKGEIRDRVQWITLNRPGQLNAYSLQMFAELIPALRAAAENPEVKLAVLTGAGKYFTAGYDMHNQKRALDEAGGDLDRATEISVRQTQDFIDACIDFPKPIIGAVNGPAIGGGMTLLPLLDAVIASSAATFVAPFAQIGLVPEFCSSYLFPRILGQSMAAEVLLFGRKLTAQEACERGLVSRVVPEADFDSYLNDWLYGPQGLVASCYPGSMMNAKRLVRSPEVLRTLHRVNQRECDQLRVVFRSDQFQATIRAFLERKTAK